MTSSTFFLFVCLHLRINLLCTTVKTTARKSWFFSARRSWLSTGPLCAIRQERWKKIKELQNQSREAETSLKSLCFYWVCAKWIPARPRRPRACEHPVQHVGLRHPGQLSCGSLGSHKKTFTKRELKNLLNRTVWIEISLHCGFYIWLFFLRSSVWIDSASNKMQCQHFHADSNIHTLKHLQLVVFTSACGLFLLFLLVH